MDVYTRMNHLSLPPELADDVARVDAIVRGRVASRTIVLDIANRSIMPATARMLAALTLLAARLGPNPDGEAALHAAATVELIYASLRVHADLMDDAERRRGLSAGQQWSGDVALMVGDYLFALAAAEMALAPDPRIIGYFSRSVMASSEGQLAPVSRVAPLDQAIDQYMYKAESETAVLFRAAAQAGMVCGGGTQAQIDTLGEIGHALGLAWHMIDDARDFGAGTPEGQMRGARLRAGEITLPLIYAADAAPQLAWDEMLGSGAPDEAHVHAMLAAVQRTGAAARACAAAQQHGQHALALLDTLPDGAAKRMLRDLIQAIVSLPL
jgi:heptaprenyl diphosphate synthase